MTEHSPGSLLRHPLAVLALLASVIALTASTCEAGNPAVRADTVDQNPIYAPTPMAAVHGMLELANVTERDTLYDLGSGDGRILIAAARKYGTRGVGIEINPDRIAEARENAREAGVSDLVTFRRADLFEVDIRPATVVTVYLLPETLEELRPKLFAELDPGTPVVSHDFLIEDWEPERSVQVRTPNGWKASATLYRWTVPAEKPAHLQESRGWIPRIWN